MSYKCKECNMEFETEAGKRLHDSINHKPTPKKKKKEKKELLTTGGHKGYLAPDGKHVISYLSDGKSKNYVDLSKKMRKDFPDIKVGDKLTPKEARDLFKHDIYIQKEIKGAKLKVIKVIENPGNGVRRYMMENSKMIVSWSEGQVFRDSKNAKLKDRHIVLAARVYKK